MAFLSAMNISGSGLTAQRMRLDIIADNIANINTTRTAEGGPYVRKYTVFQEREPYESFASHLSKARQKTEREDYASQLNVTGRGVRVSEIGYDDAEFRLEYNPQHPDADADGYVRYPNVEITTEMVDMISASRAYEANVTALNSIKSMAMKALEI